MTTLLRTPLYDWHAAHQGRLVEFGGWEMPVQYAGIVSEHNAVRNVAGIFDISHMGRLHFTGPDACPFLDHLLTNNVSKLRVGQVRYSLVCDDSGGILDDVLVYRLDNAYWLVVNASNRLKIVDWLKAHEAPFDVTWQDLTLSTGMIAVQGPSSVVALTPEQADIWSKLKYYGVTTDDTSSADGMSLMMSRTGYTGEDGFELIVPSDQLVPCWELLLARAGASQNVLQPCGLGARDTLRLEAAMPLYGHELSETIDPLTAGLDFAVKLDKPDFIGKTALIDLARQTDRRVRIGLELSGRRIAREGSEIRVNGAHCGVVTSGTYSPTLDRSISMGYVSSAFASPGTKVEVDIRGRCDEAVVVPLPFYRRDR